MISILSVKYPHNIDYNKPSNLGFIGGRNLYITTEDNARIGVWYVIFYIGGTINIFDCLWDKKIT